VKTYNCPGLQASAPRYWRDVMYCDWQAGKHPEIPMVWFNDDIIKLPETARYAKDKDGKYELIMRP
jgi:hypothetical protein